MPLNSKIANNIDWFSILLYLLLVTMGWMNIFSSSYDGDNFVLGSRYGKQMIMIFINIILLISIFFLNSSVIPSSSFVSYGIIILLLIAVLIIGSATNGAKSWFSIGGFKLQPSEFAKLATALMIAKIGGKDKFVLTKDLRSIFSILIIIAIPALLILLQGDAGSALIFASFIFVLYRQGLSFYWLVISFLGIVVFISYFFVNISIIFIVLTLIALIAHRYISGNPNESFFGFFLISVITLFGLAVIIFFNVKIKVHIIIVVAVTIISSIAIFRAIKRTLFNHLIVPALLLMYIGAIYSVDYVFENILQSHQSARITILFSPDKDITGVGYQTHQSKITIGSGGFLGKGYLKGTQTKYDFVPEQDTDYIFCTVGEEWGFIGTTFVILVFTILLLRLIFLAERQKSKFSRIFGYSLVGVLFFHYSINIAMTIGLAPVIGIPLPFFSYGGSSLFAFSIFLFIFLRLDAERNSVFA